MKDVFNTTAIITDKVCDIIKNIQRKDGLGDMYCRELSNVIDQIILKQDLLDLDNEETLMLIRTLTMLRNDMAGIVAAASK